MAKYETMLITSAALDEEATSALVGKFKSLIEANGTIDSIDEWGKRRLAYPINDEEEGVYTVILRRALRLQVYGLRAEPCGISGGVGQAYPRAAYV